MRDLLLPEHCSRHPGERLMAATGAFLPCTSYNWPLAALRKGQTFLKHRHDAAHDELEVASLGKVSGDRVVHRLARIVQRDQPSVRPPCSLGKRLAKGLWRNLAGTTGRSEQTTWPDTAESQAIETDIGSLCSMAALSIPGKAGGIEDDDIKTPAAGPEFFE